MFAFSMFLSWAIVQGRFTPITVSSSSAHRLFISKLTKRDQTALLSAWMDPCSASLYVASKKMNASLFASWAEPWKKTMNLWLRSIRLVKKGSRHTLLSRISFRKRKNTWHVTAICGQTISKKTTKKEWLMNCCNSFNRSSTWSWLSCSYAICVTTPTSRKEWSGCN